MTNITELDILSPIQEPLNDGRLFMTEGEEKIDVAGHVRFTQDFILHKGVRWHKCWMWHKFWFPYYNIIPSSCQHYCWKVVVRLHTLPQVFEMYNLQQRLDRPSKCGIEGRPFVDALYGAYFYNTGIHEGHECCELVREQVAEHISGECEVILKRACTEYEWVFGPSDKWKVSPAQQRLEKMLNERWVDHDWYAVPGKHRRAQIVSNWIKWAAVHEPEEVYLRYVDKPFTPAELRALPQKPPSRKLVTYHQEDAENMRRRVILNRTF